MEKIPVSMSLGDYASPGDPRPWQDIRSYVRDRALLNTMLGMHHFLCRKPPRCILQSILHNIWFAPAPPVLPFNIQYR